MSLLQQLNLPSTGSGGGSGGSLLDSSGGPPAAPAGPSDTGAGKSSVNLLDPGATLGSFTDFLGNSPLGQLAGGLGDILGVNASQPNQGVLGAIGGIGVGTDTATGGAAANIGSIGDVLGGGVETYVGHGFAQSRIKTALGQGDLSDQVLNFLGGAAAPALGALMPTEGLVHEAQTEAAQGAQKTPWGDVIQPQQTPSSSLFGKEYDNTVPQAILDQVQSGQMTVSQAADYMQKNGIAINNDPTVSMVGEGILDPMSWTGMEGIVAKAGVAVKAAHILDTLNLAQLGDHAPEMTLDLIKGIAPDVAADISKGKMAVKTWDQLGTVTKIAGSVYNATMGGARSVISDAAHTQLAKLVGPVTNGFIQHVGVPTVTKAVAAFKDIPNVTDAIGHGAVSYEPELLARQFGSDYNKATKLADAYASKASQLKLVAEDEAKSEAVRSQARSAIETMTQKQQQALQRARQIQDAGEARLAEPAAAVTSLRRYSPKDLAQSVQRLAQTVAPFIPKGQAKDVAIEAWSKVTGLDPAEVEQRLVAQGIKFTQKDAQLALVAAHGASVKDLLAAHGAITAEEAAKAKIDDVNRVIVVSERTLTVQDKKTLLQAIASGNKDLIDTMMQHKDMLIDRFGTRTPSDTELKNFLKQLPDDSLVNTFKDTITGKSKLPQALEDWKAKWGGTPDSPVGKRLGFAPEDAWKTVEDEDGNRYLTRPFVPMMGDPGHTLTYRNGIGRLMDGFTRSVANSTLNASARFRLTNEIVKHGGGEVDARRFFNGLNAAARDQQISIRGLAGHNPSFWDKLFSDTAGPEALRRFKAGGGDVQFSVLKAYEGNWNEIGLTQKATGALKTGTTAAMNRLVGTGHMNPVTYLADNIYPTIRFKASPIFQLQQSIESGVFGLFRGIRPNEIDPDVRDIIQGTAQASRDVALSYEEYTPAFMAGSEMIDGFVDPKAGGMLPQALQRLMNVADFKNRALVDQIAHDAGPQFVQLLAKNDPQLLAKLYIAYGTDPTDILAGFVSRGQYFDEEGAAIADATRGLDGQSRLESGPARLRAQEAVPEDALQTATREATHNAMSGLDSAGQQLPPAAQLPSERALRGRLTTPGEVAQLKAHGQSLIEGHLAQASEPLRAFDANSHAVAEDLYKRTMGKDWGGATYDPIHGGYIKPADTAPASGEIIHGPYASAHPGSATMSRPIADMQDPQKFEDALHEFVTQNHDLLSKPGSHIGTFQDMDKGTVDFDVALKTDSEQGAEALQLAHGPGAEGAYDFTSGNGIFAPRAYDPSLPLAQNFKDTFNLTGQQGDDLAQVFSARAKAWSAETGRPASEFLPTYIRAMARGKSELSDDLAQVQEHFADAATEADRMDSLSGAPPKSFLHAGQGTYSKDDWGPIAGSKVAVNIPGGRDVAALQAGKWSPWDLFKLKNQTMDPTDWTPEFRDAFYGKLFRSVSDPARFTDPIDTANRMMFAVTSSRTNLHVNEGIMGYLRVHDQAEMEHLASLVGDGMSDKQIGAAIMKDRNAVTKPMADIEAEVKAANPGLKGADLKAAVAQRAETENTGLNVVGENVGRAARNVKRMVENPDWYTMHDGETATQYAERIGATVVGGDMKVPNFMMMLADPEHFPRATVDSHMMEWLDNRGLLDQDLQKLHIPGSRGGQWQAPEPLKMPYRVTKDYARKNGLDESLVGEINPNLPPHLQNLPEHLLTNNTVGVYGGNYEKANELVKAELAKEKAPFSVGGYQWREWDTKRHLASPHTAVAPGIDDLPAQDREQLVKGVKAGNAAGLKGDLRNEPRSTIPLSDIYYQGDTRKGATQFYDDGTAILKGFQTSDVSTGFHELAHVFRRTMAPDDTAAVEKFYGIADHNWTVMHEERYAYDFERYMGSGKSPAPELDGVFQRAKQWLVNIYHQLRGSPGTSVISPEMQQVFDHMLVARDLTPAEAVAQVATHGPAELGQAEEGGTLAERQWQYARRRAMENGDPEPPKPLALRMQEAAAQQAPEKAVAPVVQQPEWIRRAQANQLPGKTLAEVHELAQHEPQAIVGEAVNGIGMTAADVETVHEALTYALSKSSAQAWKTHYIDPGRSFLNRTLNHPFLGLYPVSYMWGKVVPEFTRFLLVRPFGLDAPLAGFTAMTRIQKAIAGAIVSDPGLQDWVNSNPDLIYVVNLMLPSQFTSINVNAPAWARHIYTGQPGAGNPGQIFADTATSIGLGRDISNAFGIGKKPTGAPAGTPGGAIFQGANDIGNFANSLLDSLTSAAKSLDIQSGNAAPAQATKLPPGIFQP